MLKSTNPNLYLPNPRIYQNFAVTKRDPDIPNTN